MSILYYIRGEATARGFKLGSRVGLGLRGGGSVSPARVWGVAPEVLN